MPAGHSGSGKLSSCSQSSPLQSKLSSSLSRHARQRVHGQLGHGGALALALSEVHLQAVDREASRSAQAPRQLAGELAGSMGSKSGQYPGTLLWQRPPSPCKWPARAQGGPRGWPCKLPDITSTASWCTHIAEAAPQAQLADGLQPGRRRACTRQSELAGATVRADNENGGCGHTADRWLLWRAPAAACKRPLTVQGRFGKHLCGLGAIGGSGRKADQSVVGTRQVGAALPALVRACGLGQTVMR